MNESRGLGRVSKTVHKITQFQSGLLARQFFVFGKVLFDERNEGTELRIGRLGTSVSAWIFVMKYLVNGAIVHAKAFGGFSFGDTFNEKGVADFSPKFHVFEHRVAIG